MTDDDSKSIDLNTILAKVAVEGIKEIGTDLKKRVQEILDKNKFGITTTREEAKQLWEINKSERYQRLEDCIGDHWALRLLNVGLYISYLNDEGRQKAIIKRIEKEVYDEHYSKGIKVLRISTTGVIANIINYLSDLKMNKNLSQVDIGIELDRIIDEWEKIAILVKSGNDETKLRIEIVEHMRKQLPLFFVFAYGSASIPAYKIIAEINVEGVIRRFNYIFSTNLKQDGAGLDVYAWVFELIKKEVII